MDVQLCIFDLDGIPLTQQPQVLREYAEKFHYLYVNPPSLKVRY